MYLNKQDTMAMAENSRAMIAERLEQSFVQKCLYEFYDEIMNKCV